MLRWKQRYDKHGYDGLLDRRTQQPSRSGFRSRLEGSRRCCGSAEGATSILMRSISKLIVVADGASPRLYAASQSELLPYSIFVIDIP